MQCPKCGHLEDRVIDSRPLADGAAIRRRRECLKCGHRFTTYEEIERDNLRVQKRDGRYEAFDRKKLLAGMEKASEKRPISRAVLERAAERIIQELTEEYGEEFPSVAIGEKVMEKLRVIDEVAFVRFASVYRKFRDIREFVNEIENLKPYDRISAGLAQPDLVE
ncbi:MAG: transcriptional regulator NrdR [Methylacidiphilales bacterium]|nr:transcriptional regulator NrdR [Candidatus Methylacidiphilales bacterium]MDW8350054.1 transcriptional regulator NrdR [Verrucomicrobiae bacterium]